ncbi:DUF1080 domain-containing protein [Maribacter algarum]|uniref:DUF1080 domain-containing protein n=1 Tax=Maribacter algarum (ex Zhang et al. 2020) TaxID=2578118 RepID=A0A5S3PXN0_9FLAO|nr:DUF1080 domain-containing protein [Maribacter algarum]TMM59012.1 DUF1080 domain-containing protein [Maribacter algarum]
MKAIRNIITTALLLLGTSTNCLAQNEDDWKTLFNEENLEGWTTKIHHYEVGDNYGDTFRVEDSIIKVRYDKYEGDFNDRFAHLYYHKPFSYFHLSLEYRFVGDVHPGSPIYVVKNSGVMYHSEDPKKMLKEQNWPISVEIQFLAGIEEGKERPTGNMCSPGTDVEFEGKIDPRHCINSSSKTYFGDQWVKAELIVRGDSLVTHLINGETVLEYTRPQLGRTGVVKGARPEMNKSGKLLKEGFIALQSEGQPIDFRNIKIKNLKGCMNPKAKNFKKHYIKADNNSCVYE